MRRYPRTPHLEGSRLQPGDEDLDVLSVADLRGTVVVEEKLDGANAGLRFTEDGELLLQSRGHFLTGGPRERQFAFFKSWAARHAGALWEVLGPGRLLYGEWLYAKHTIFYDRLPHFFVEFDVLDLATGEFLDTARRRDLLAGAPVVSAPVLWEGPVADLPALAALVRPPAWQSPAWRERLGQHAAACGMAPDRVWSETDGAGLLEGLYVKVEGEGRVLSRAKWVRGGFRQAVEASGSHWMDRPLLPNLLEEGVDLF